MLFHPCLESTIAISRSEECTASRRTRSTSSGRVPDRFTVLCLTRTGSSVRAPPCQINSTDRGIPGAVDVQDDVVEQRAQQFLAVTIGCALSVPHPAEFAGETTQRPPLWLSERSGTMPVKLGQREPLTLDIG